MIQELRLFFESIGLWLFGLLGLVAIVMTPLYQGQSIAVTIFLYIVQDLVPPSVELVASHPLDAFLTLVGISLAIAFIIAFPLLLYGILEYLSPALSLKELLHTIYIVIPSAGLFIGGTIFAYLYVVPTTFTLLYGFADVIEARQLFQASELIALTFSIMITTGVFFLLPIGMFLVSTTGMVDRGFWLRGWRYALAFFFIFSAIITPDGTGITMLILCLPFTVLYALGCILSGVFGRKNYS